MSDRTLIQTHVLRRYFVSTIYRQSSSSIWPCWYYETLAWEWDEDSRTRGALVRINLDRPEPSYRAAALMQHARVCAQLAEESAEFSPDDEDEEP